MRGVSPRCAKAGLGGPCPRIRLMVSTLPRRGALLAAFFLAGCATLGSSPTEMAQTWDLGRIYFPGFPYWLTTDADPPASVTRPTPTVLYLHGCAGIRDFDDLWARTLSGAGYAVVMPNSFARPGRVSGCAQVRWEIYNLRAEEIGYAQERLRRLPWVDQRNIFLMGHSEGGGSVALWSASGFRGHVISGWPCTHRVDPFFDGVRAPSSTPVLALNFERDPEFSGAMVGRCGAKLVGRQDSRELVLRGSGHFPMYSEEARQAVVEFLRTHTQP
jgi:fermentation-respiration switch protein FrsA (DUF1100 family)